MDWRPLSLAFLVDFSAVLFPPVLAKAGVDWWNASNTVILALLVFAGLTFAAVGVVWKGEMSTGGAALFAIFGLFLGILTLLSIWFAANTQGSAYLSCLAINAGEPAQLKCNIASDSARIVWLLVGSFTILGTVETASVIYLRKNPSVLESPNHGAPPIDSHQIYRSCVENPTV